jgi:hypothetical protein
VSSSQSVNTILSYYGDLIYKLKRIIRAKLIFTSILPRLVDHRDPESKVFKLQKGCTRLAAANDKVYHLLAHGRWFSPGTPVSSTTKTGRQDIAEILLKVALKHQKSKSKYFTNFRFRISMIYKSG